MSAASPQPNNTLLLAVLGIGAFWLMTRRATAQTVPVRTGAGTSTSSSNTAGAIGNILNGLGRVFGGSGSATTSTGTTGRVGEIANDDVPGQPGYGWRYFTDGTVIGPDGTYYQDGQPIWSPSTDQIAYNPPGNESVWDAMNQG